jgi:hypothetical protein
MVARWNSNFLLAFRAIPINFDQFRPPADRRLIPVNVRTTGSAGPNNGCHSERSEESLFDLNIGQKADSSAKNASE